MTLTIGGVDIGGDAPCRFVAELSGNHNGSLARCLRLIAAAKDAGADFIKTQCYSADELVALRGDGPAPEPWGSMGWTMRALYEKAATPFDWFPVIADFCRDLEIPWFSSVFGAESLAVMEANGCPAYKLARLDVDAGSRVARDLFYAVARARKPLLASTGDRDALVGLGGAVVSPIGDGGPTRVLTSWALLYCPPQYPTPIEGVHLPECFNALSWGQRSPIGLSSHCLDPLLPVAAVARGCKLIEMHFMLDDEPSELEANISLRASDFAQMIRDVRRVEAMLA